MKLTTEKIRTMSFDELYKLLTPTLRKIGKEYSYISLSNTAIDNWLKKIVEEKYKKIMNSDKITSINFSAVVKKNINHYLKKAFTEGNGLEIFNRYVDKNIKERKKPQYSLKKIADFFYGFNYYPSNEIYLSLLNNKRVSKILAKVVDEKKYLLGKMDIEKIFNDDISISFVETYCMLNNIKLVQDDIDNDIDNYMNDKVANYSSLGTSLLTEEEKMELLIRVKQGDKIARDIMVEKNLRLVIKIAIKYQGRGLEISDLIQEGSIGLMKSIDRFDLKKGCRFSTYATWWIRQAIVRATQEQGRAIRIPSHLNEKSSKIKNVVINLEKELGREPTTEEIANKLNISTKEIEKILNLSQTITSINQRINDDNYSELGDFIENNTATPEEATIEKVTAEEIRDKLSILNDRQQQIIKLRFGLDGDEPKTLQEIGDIIGCSRENVRLIELKILKKLKRSMYKWRDEKAISKSDVPVHNSRSRDNIYDYFRKYSKEEINEVIEELGDRALTVLHMRYGDDFANLIFDSNLTEQDKIYLKRYIFPKLKKALEKNKKTRIPKEIPLISKVSPPTDSDEKLDDLLESANLDAEKVNISETTRERKNIITNEYIKKLETGVKKMNELENIKTTQNRKNKKSRSNIYDYFSEYEKGEIDEVIEGLDEKSLMVLHIKYGEDFANPVNGTLSEDDKKFIQGCVFPKIKRRLMKKKTIAIKEKIASDNKKTISCNEESSVLVDKTSSDKENTGISELKIESENNVRDEYIRSLEIFNRDEFKEITKTKSIKEIIVLSLAFGYVDDKYFFANSIASFLGIEQEEVTTIIKSGVVEYKEKLNEIIDKSLDKMTEVGKKENPKVYVKTLGKKQK
mgnify:FL=1